MNPVLIALEKELDRFKSSAENRSLGKNISTFINKLCSLWNSYEGRIKEDVYGEKILELGDFLYNLKYYKLASDHCYGRYLQSKYGNFLDIFTNKDENSLLEIFFPDVNNNLEVVKTIRALIGFSSSACLSIIDDDALFQNAETPSNVALLLKLMQLAMQIGLKRDSHCWLVYNGTIHLYNICCVLMKHGFSRHILKYMLWSCVCMESSVPLMTVKYFSWRSQLYLLTCQCYFDLKADAEAEKFAQRGLQKVEELKEIEKISSLAATPESTFMFSQATIKLNIIVFKRQVFESKRRAKGTLRSKIKPVLKDIIHTQWPRTGTERLLAELFRSRASQFLAVIEALTNSNRRLVQTSLGATENDDCLDAYSELFFAGIELLAGGGGPKPPVPGKHDLPISGVVNGIPLINLAAAESQSISLASVVQFVKLSYNYESWESFDLLFSPLIEELKNHPGDQNCEIELDFLNLLSVISPINPSRIKKKMLTLKTDELESTQTASKNRLEHIENLLSAATMLNDHVKDKKFNVFVSRYHDALVDIIMIFWTKCRKHFSRINSSLYEANKYQDKYMFHWLRLLIITQNLMIKLNLNDIDVCACAEASLKLSVVLECIACYDLTRRETYVVGDRTAGCMSQTEQSIKSCKTPDEEAQESLLFSYFKEICSFLKIPEKANNLLNFVKEMLHITLNSIASARDNMLKPHAGVADDSFSDPSGSSIEDMYTLNMQAYHLEIFYQYYHIISLMNARKLSELNVSQGNKKGNDSRKNIQKSSDESKLGISVSGKNDLLKSLFLLSAVEVQEKVKTEENTQHLEEAYIYIQKAIQVESKIRSDNVTKGEVHQAVPPPPVLVNRGSSWMVLKPAPFKPLNGVKIRWYCVYLRNASGNNVKVRLNDTKYKGTGVEVPYQNNCIFTVKGLEPNERYMAAVAAYDKSGKLIGGSIGESSSPFLAAHILPCLPVYAKLCRITYNKNIWRVSKKVFNVIWDHYVEREEDNASDIKSATDVYNLQPNRLKNKNVANSSLVTLRYFVETIFINVDVAVKEGSLFCDSLCDKGPLSNGQIARLNLCEKLLIAIEVCGWINDNMLCLQAVILTYGLLAPTMHWKLPIVAALKVLLHIHCVLQEIQTIFKNKKQNSTTESLRHMVCCLGYYVAKILMHFKKKREAIDVLESTSKLIVQMNPPEGKTKTQAAIADDDTGSLTGKKVKKTKPKLKAKVGMLKSLSEFLPGNLLEIRALEIYTLKLQREMMSDCNNELTGNEDVVVMNAVVSTLPIPQAYKEVVKFKRKAQFFEAFVGILGRALNEGSYESVLDWVKETMSWLTKRNEIILNKPASDPKGIVVTASNAETDKLKRYSNTVVEYGRASVASTIAGKYEGDRRKSDMHGGASTHGSVYGGSKAMVIAPEAHGASKHLLPIVEGSEAGFSTITQKGKAHKNHDEKKAITSEEKRIKEACGKLQGLLLELWRTMQRRKKMRNVCFEELPWRCQMNLISAECHFQMCLTAFKNISKQHGCPELKKEESVMDVNWFTLSTTGTMIVSWIGCMKTCENSMEPVVDIGGTTIDHKPEVHIVPSVSKQTISVKVEKKASSMKGTSSHRSEEQRKEEQLKQFLYHLEHVYLHYQRAIVLSHRGRNWVLLQQACNKLLTTTHKLMVNIMLLNTNIDTTTYDIPYKLSKLRTVIYNPLFLAAEFLLECMNDIGSQRMPEGELNVYGSIRKNNGGCSLKYDYLDCNSYIDYGNIKRVIMFAIEVLFYEQKWERVIGIIMKLNAVSLGHFSESLLPLLIVAQKYLFDRLRESDSTLNCHPSIIFDQETGVPLDISLVPIPAPEQIEAAAHLDPIGHNLYEIPTCGSKYSIVPVEYDSACNKLVQITDGRPLYSRMLEHARKLCMAYLASRQGNKHIEGKFQRIDSAVSFVATQVKPPLVTPVDYKNEGLESIEDIETHPLSKKLLSTVIETYENTIELLKNAKQNGLTAQAMHELGNIMFHCKNVKSSFKWWSYALDTILHVTNGLKNWRGLLIDLEKNSLKSFKPLLDKCGIWGCMLGGILATKIARYIHFAHLDMCRNSCLMAAAFFKALFSSSLVHPTSYHSYTEYNIGVNNTITQIVPGLNLFSDDHRIHCNNLSDCSLWLSQRLIKFGFYLEVQPILTWTQYLSSNICLDIPSAVEVKLLRIESLCNLNMFGCAIRYFCQIMLGRDIPKTSDLLKLKLSSKLQKFDDNLLMFDQHNASIINNEFFNLTLKDVHYNTYGQYLCDKILLMQAYILVSMATIIYEIPIVVEKPVTEDSTKIHHKTSLVQKSIDEKLSEQVQKTATKEESLIDTTIQELTECPGKLKGKLLQYAESIVNRFSEKLNPPTPEDLEMYVRTNILLSKINCEKLLTVSSIRHVYLCLKAISSLLKNPGDVANLKDMDEISTDPGSKLTKLPKNIDIHTWLSCRELLCFYLSSYDNVMEKVAFTDFFDEVGSVEENINNAVAECDMFNDRASSFIFQMMSIDIDVKYGKDATGILADLKNLEEKINLMPEQSFPTKCLLIDLKKLDADLKALKEADAKKSIADYEKVELLILDELCFHGYNVDIHKRFPLVDILNVNSALLEDLMCVKVSRHRATALATAVLDKPVDLWKEIIEEVDRVFDIMERITIVLPLQKVELLLLKGVVQRRLVELGKCNINVCVKTFLEVINLSRTFTCDFSTIRQCYLEISMILFHTLKLKEEEWNRMNASKAKTAELRNTPTPPESPAKLKRKNSTLPAKTTRKSIVPEKNSSKEMNRLGKGIWICIRAASIIAKAQQKKELLAGEISMTSEQIPLQGKNNLPLFVFEDILGMINMKGDGSSSSSTVTWATLLNYSTHLRRGCGYASLVIGENKVSIVRVPRKCHIRALKLSEICRYLENYSAAYQENCTCFLPMDSISSILKLSYSATRSEAALEMAKDTTIELSNSVSSPGNLQSQMEDGRKSKSPAPSQSPNFKITNPLNPEKAKELEIAVQWYLPELDNPFSNKMNLLIAANNKYVVAKSPSAQFSQVANVQHHTVHLEELFALHEHMVHLMEEEEASFALLGEQNAQVSSMSPTTSKSPARKSKAPPQSPRPASKSTSQTKVNPKRGSLNKIEKVDEYQKRLSLIVSLLSRLLAGHTSSEEETSVENIPFEANWNTITSLASWMNPSFGHITKTTEALFNWMMDVFGIPNNI